MRLATALLLAVTAPLFAQNADCRFSPAPEDRLHAEVRARIDAVARAGIGLARGARAIEIRNLVDEEIFTRLEAEKVAPARLTSDEEFLRRVTLDLTGRLPEPDRVREFLADAAADKRAREIDRLLNTAAFVDRWSQWLGDLLENVTRRTNTAVGQASRDNFWRWIRKAIQDNRPFDQIARSVVTATGNKDNPNVAPVVFNFYGYVAMGPEQDTSDMMLLRSASTFLGMGYYDCLLCHSGRGRLDGLNLWGQQTSRLEAQRMAAFFAKSFISLRRGNVDDLADGRYELNTDFGNRPARTPIGDTAVVEPRYRDGGQGPSGGWRESFADQMTADPLFAINLVNRVWKEMFTVALVDPVDTLDPARLDPANPPPDPWKLQASHPALLARLAAEFRNGHDLRRLVRTIANSSAYQLAADYAGEWRPEYATLFARRLPRRLEAEELADALGSATGVVTMFYQSGGERYNSAMQIPDPLDWNYGFLASFNRGNRDGQKRDQGSSILQRLALMNDAFVGERLNVTASPVLREAAGLGDAEAVELLFLRFLARMPASAERDLAVKSLTGAADRNRAVEDLAWALANKIEFSFSY